MAASAEMREICLNNPLNSVLSLKYHATKQATEQILPQRSTQQNDLNRCRPTAYKHKASVEVKHSPNT